MAIDVKVDGLNTTIAISLSGISEIDTKYSESINIVDAIPYTGVYDVTPDAQEAIVLPTTDRLLRDDVTVRKIPYESVSNPQGGETVTIGGY